MLRDTEVEYKGVEWIKLAFLSTMLTLNLVKPKVKCKYHTLRQLVTVNRAINSLNSIQKLVFIVGGISADQY